MLVTLFSLVAGFDAGFLMYEGPFHPGRLLCSFARGSLPLGAIVEY